MVPGSSPVVANPVTSTVALTGPRCCRKSAAASYITAWKPNVIFRPVKPFEEFHGVLQILNKIAASIVIAVAAFVVIDPMIRGASWIEWITNRGDH